MAATVDNTIAQLPAQALMEFAARIVARSPEAARLAPLSADDLAAVADGGEAPSVPDVSALAAWVDRHRNVISGLYPHTAPPFDHLIGYWENFYRGPQGGGAIQSVPGRRPTAHLLGFELGVPFGVPACAVTPHSGYIEHFAKRGFDLLTYKTVRETTWKPYTSPNLGFAGDLVEPIKEPQIDSPVTASLYPDALHASRTASFVNSIGVPSLPANQWMTDVEHSRETLRRGQVLIVSVMGSPEALRPGEDAQLVAQFARVAGHAKEAGADIVELNLSCPNTGGELLCRDAGLSSRIVCEVRRAVGDTPILIKISYLPEDLLTELVRSCQREINGVVAINAVQVSAYDRHGSPFFSNRANAHAGLSGIGIRELGLATTRRLSALRGDETSSPADWVIIGIGGVMSASDFQAYRDEGADGVQSCTGAWLNLRLAAEVRSHVLGEPEAADEESPADELEQYDKEWGEDDPQHPWRRLLVTVNDAVRTGGLSLRTPEPATSDDDRDR